MIVPAGALLMNVTCTPKLEGVTGVQLSTWQFFGQASPSVVLPSSQVSGGLRYASTTPLPHPGALPGSWSFTGTTHWPVTWPLTPAFTEGAHAPFASALVRAVVSPVSAFARQAGSTQSKSVVQETVGNATQWGGMLDRSQVLRPLPTVFETQF